MEVLFQLSPTMREPSDEREHPQNTLRDQPRYARLGAPQENPVGVCIFLSKSDLYELNIDPDDRKAVEYRIRELGTDRVVSISVADPAQADTPTPSTTD